MKSIAIFGRLPALSIAELESLYGAEHVLPFGDHALLDLEPKQIAFDRLGGSLRLAKILAPLEVKNWGDVEKYLLKTIGEHASHISGKLNFGLSVFGFTATPQQVSRTALQLKKVIKKAGKSVRMVPHSGTELNTATVFHNKLTGLNGWELLIVGDGKQTYLAQTTNVQNIDAYAARDQARPKRDTRVGMLPPKLAQTIINLASAEISFEKNRVINAWDETYTRPFDVLDPFSGTGVILQEALLMGYSALGSDKDARMVEFATKNITWLKERFKLVESIFEIYIGDATELAWGKFRFVASETYLGPPLTRLPDPAKMRQLVHDISRLHNQFLQNIGRQIKSGTRLCLAVPAWKTQSGFLHLSTLDKLQDLGYTRIKFRYAPSDKLIYHRDGQLVARELLVLTKE